MKKTYGDDFQESEFNMGFGTIDRLNRALDRVNYFFSMKDYPMVLKELQVTYSEVFPFLNPKEISEQNDYERILLNYLRLHYKGKTFNATRNLDDALREWDRYLRKLLLRYKLYMKMQDSRLAAMKI